MKQKTRFRTDLALAVLFPLFPFRHRHPLRRPFPIAHGLASVVHRPHAGEHRIRDRSGHAHRTPPDMVQTVAESAAPQKQDHGRTHPRLPVRSGFGSVSAGVYPGRGLPYGNRTLRDGNRIRDTRHRTHGQTMENPEKRSERETLKTDIPFRKSSVRPPRKPRTARKRPQETEKRGFSPFVSINFIPLSRRRRTPTVRRSQKTETR